MKRWVAVSSSDIHDYSGFLPFVGILWRDRIGYEPIFFLVGSYESWRECRHKTLVPDHLKSMGFRIEWVEPIDGVEDGTVAQSIRLHAAALHDLASEDLLIPSDADLLPIRRSFYYQHDFNKWPIGSYYSNGYGDDKEGYHYPSCHVSARVGHWKEFMGLDSDDPRLCMMKTFEKIGLSEKIKKKIENPKEGWQRVWWADEDALSMCLKQSQFWPDRIQNIRRVGQPPKDRLDRACWPEKYNPEDYSDCHSIRPFWSDDNWPRLLPLLKATIDWNAWGGVLPAYREEFKAAILETV